MKLEGFKLFILLILLTAEETEVADTREGQGSMSNIVQEMKEWTIFSRCQQMHIKIFLVAKKEKRCLS